MADFFDAQIDAGRQPNQFARIWIHTHPGDSPQPSAVDEECFQRVFGLCGHAVMFIVAQGGKTYARIELNVGPGGSLLLPMEVDYRHPFVASDHGAWQTEYDANIHAQKSCASPANLQREGAEGFYLADYWAQELAEMEPDERQAVLADLGSDPDAWPEALYW